MYRNSSSFLYVGDAVGDSQFGKPNKTVFLSEVDCSGDERIISECDSIKRAADDGKGAHVVIEAAGVRCGAPPRVNDEKDTGTSAPLIGAVSSGPTIAIVIMAVVLVVALVAIVG